MFNIFSLQNNDRFIQIQILRTYAIYSYMELEVGKHIRPFHVRGQSV